MNKKNTLVTLSILILMMFSTGCNFVSVRGSGQISEIEKNIPTFYRVDASGQFNIDVKFGETSTLKVLADDNLMKYIKAEVVGDKLYLSTKKSLAPSRDIEVFLVTPKLVEANLSGANDMVINNISGEIFKIEISGAASLDIDGSLDAFDAEISGAGDLNGKNLQTKIAKIEVSGAGNGILNVSEELYAEVSGAADLIYIGEPKIVKQNVSGAGSIRKK